MYRIVSLQYMMKQMNYTWNTGKMLGAGPITLATSDGSLPLWHHATAAAITAAVFLVVL